MVGQNFNAFGNPYGNSPVRTAHLLWQLKMFLMKQMGLASKKGATDKLWATAPHGNQKVEVTLGNGDKEIVSATEAVRRMMTDMEAQDSFVTGPREEGYEITTLGNQANLEQFVAVINALNVWIFRCFLMPSLILTDGQAGSRSLGDKHFQLVDKVTDQEAESFGEMVINEFIERSIIENFGEQDDYGKFNKRPQGVEERAKLAAMFGTLGNDGWMKPHVKEDMEFVRDNLNLPEDKDPSFGLTGNIPGEPKPGEAPPENGDDNDDDQGDDDQ